MEVSIKEITTIMARLENAEGMINMLNRLVENGTSKPVAQLAASINTHTTKIDEVDERITKLIRTLATTTEPNQARHEKKIFELEERINHL
ncbi:MAG: hypothetical protein V3R78_09945 [Thermodesulfobacteriota bacterium]